MRPAALVIGALLLLAGLPRPASAQIDLSGIWAPVFHEDQPERIPGPEIGDYAGLPITEAARLRAETWDASLLTLPEHQCKPHPSTYGFRGVGNLRITPVYNDSTQQLIKFITTQRWFASKTREVTHAHILDSASLHDGDGMHALRSGGVFPPPDFDPPPADCPDPDPPAG